MRDPKKDEECLRLYSELLPKLSDYVDKHAQERPDDLAIIEYNTGIEITWREFKTSTRAFAAKLLNLGLKKGDIVATTLPLLKEHIFLMYACYRIGVIIAPLDLRLKFHEVDRSFAKIKPKAYFFLGKTDVNDFRPMVGDLMDRHPECEYWIQFDTHPSHLIRGATWIVHFAADIDKIYIQTLLTGELKNAEKLVTKRDPCLIIFTTGSTGWPKPALLCHENIQIQNIGIKVAFDITPHDRMCVNLPPSHVGCVTEQLATTIYAGGVSVILHIFDAEKTLDAVQKYNVTAFGQIPALFNMQWRLENYSKYNLSSLRFALYGGQAVTKEFLEKLATMAPQFGTGLGLTETAGFVTYTPLDGTVVDILASVGFDMPLCPVSIRDGIQPDGNAGPVKNPGEIGEIAFSGPQIFLGYLNDSENTQKTISKNGFCYTGDLGYYDEKGLHFAGRSKLVIKPKGYQVFPTEIEEWIESHLLDKVEMVACVGAPHEVFTEGIIAFVERKPEVTLNTKEVLDVCKDLAAYKRPSHVEILEPEQMPLNRVAKTDYMVLKSWAKKLVQKLRDNGGWDKK
jgi:acyl-CoA synthetase (AMP-forming)/AMP-acid ligase II